MLEVQRQAERVTATEVSLVANELQDALGGVYGILTTEFQLPYLTSKLAIKAKETYQNFKRYCENKNHCWNGSIGRAVIELNYYNLCLTLQERLVQKHLVNTLILIMLLRNLHCKSDRYSRSN